jgi:hypothetical protein
MSLAKAMPNSDFDSINELVLRIAEKGRKLGIHSLTDFENTVSLIWHASGIVENGGFQYFYEHEFDAEAVAQAYERIGCAKCAEILRLSWSLFPDSLQTASLAERIEYMRQNKDLFYDLSNLFWEADTQMESRLAEYVKGKFNN